MQTKAREPPNGEIDLRLAHQPAVVHDPEQKTGQHQPDCHLRVDAGPPRAVRGIAPLHFGTQP